MIRRPPRSTRTDTLFPYTTLFRSCILHLTDGHRCVLDQRASRDSRSSIRTPISAWPSNTVPTLPARKFSSAMERSEEHTSELQSLMRISYAVFCLKKKKKPNNIRTQHKTKKDTENTHSQN